MTDLTPMDWERRIDPSKSYDQDEIAAFLGVASHEIACTMQVGIIRGKQRHGDKWYATGDALLEWGTTIGMLCDEVQAMFDLPLPLPSERLAMIAEPEPEPIPEVSPPIEPVVYFALCGEHIKIGFTRGNPRHRLKTLSTANPLPVELIATMPGSQELEMELHERFGEFRIRGEWFVFADPIRAYIASASGPKP